MEAEVHEILNVICAYAFHSIIDEKWCLIYFTNKRFQIYKLANATRRTFDEIPEDYILAINVGRHSYHFRYTLV